MGITFESTSNILFFGFLIFGTAILFFQPISETLLLFSFFSFIVSWTSAVILKRRKIYGNGSFWMLINVFLWLNILGEMGLYYNNYVNYDKIIHFLFGILLTAIVYKDFSQNIKLRKEYVFLSVLGIFVVWEIYEFILTTFFNYPAAGVFVNGQMIMNQYDDTMSDIICGSVGSLLYLSIKNKVKKLKK